MIRDQFKKTNDQKEEGKERNWIEREQKRREQREQRERELEKKKKRRWEEGLNDLLSYSSFRYSSATYQHHPTASTHFASPWFSAWGKGWPWRRVSTTMANLWV
jgi:hypothetical protein